MAETLYQKIQRKTGRKPSECKCNLCKMQCKTPRIGTPEDMQRIIDAGYEDRVTEALWSVGMMYGLCNFPVPIVASKYDKEKKACTFFTNGLCELHEKWLKPTEGKLSHHTTRLDNFDVKKSLAWTIIKEWLK